MAKHGGAMKGFQKILRTKVSEIRRRGNRTAGGKKVKNPEAYVAAGLRRTGIKKLGAKRFKARQKAGR
ncbi:MAG: hypothetical protein ACREBU_26655 [Nitrososphaera sp.]